MAYGDNKIGNLDKICPSMGLALIGTKLDDLNTALNTIPAGKYSGDFLTEKEIYQLNNMCSVGNTVQLGTIINNLLTASKNSTEVDVLTDINASLLDSSMCGGAEICSLGTSIQEWQAIVNGEFIASQANITSFSINDVNGVINESGDTPTITVTLPSTVEDVSSLVATFVVSDGATVEVNDIEQTSGTTENDFTNHVNYIVTAKNGITTKTYEVIVDVEINTEAKITSFTITNQLGDTTIDDTNGTIALTMPAETDVSSLIATFVLSHNATASIGDVEQTSGVTSNNFDSNVTYTITAEDTTTTKNYVVTITVAS